MKSESTRVRKSEQLVRYPEDTTGRQTDMQMVRDREREKRHRRTDGQNEK